MKNAMKYLCALGIVAIGAFLRYKYPESDCFGWSLFTAILIACS